jgi:hypothetical protein
MQRRDLPTAPAADKRDRVLLFISKKMIDFGNADVDDNIQSIPDAWVYGDNFAVLVETKIDNAAFSLRQIQAHRARLHSTAHKSPREVLKTWGDIHGFFRDLLPKLTNASSAKLLVGQFIEYLEYTGMTEFNGFQIEHFRYFLLHDDDDARSWIRNQVDYFAALVQECLYQSIPFYESADVGNLRLADEACWAAFGPRGSTYRKVTHQTISLSSNGLRVFVNCELKMATDRLKRILKISDIEFRRTLQNLHSFEPFELVLEERTQRQASIYDYNSKMRLHSSLLDEASGDEAWTAFKKTVERMPLPYLRIERLVSPQKLISLSSEDPKDVVKYISEMLRQNHDVVDMMNV